MSYTRYGPFSDGSSPAIDAAFLNAVENLLVLINTVATDSNISSATGVLTAVNAILSGGLLGKSSAGDILDASTTSTILKAQTAINLAINGTTQASISSSGLTIASGAIYGTDASNTIIQSTGTSGTGNMRIQNTDHISLQVPGGSEAIGINSSQVTIERSLIFNGQLGVSTAGDVIDASAGVDTYIKCRSGGNINFQSPNGTTVAHFDSSGLLNVIHSINLVNGSLGQLKNFSGTGSATVSTGITNPTTIAFNPCTASGSSQTIGGTIASSSVVTTGGGLAWAGTAWHA